MSSNVAGQPPPANDRRYSRFHAAYPRAARSAASGLPSSSPYLARQKPPWTMTTVPFLAGGLAGRHSSPYCASCGP